MPASSLLPYNKVADVLMGKLEMEYTERAREYVKRIKTEPRWKGLSS